MLFRNSIATLIFFALSSLPAHAAPPKVTGKYALIGSALCSARQTETVASYKLANNTNGNAVKSLTQTEGGIVSALTGYVTFTPSAAGSTHGSYAMSLQQVRGPNASINLNPPNSGWQTKTFTESGAYSATNNTVILKGDTWIMTYANVSGGIARTVNLVRRETGANPNCVDAIAVTKQ